MRCETEQFVTHAPAGPESRVAGLLQRADDIQREFTLGHGKCQERNAAYSRRHAGAIVSGSRGTAAAKAEALEAKGVRVGRTPTQVAELAVSLLGAAA